MTRIARHALLIALLIAASAALPQAATADGLWESTVHVVNEIFGVDGHRTRVQWSDDANGHRISFSLNGEIEFTPDDRGIEALSPGGELEIEVRRLGTLRRARMRADRHGMIEREWSKGDGWLPWDAAAAEWLAEVLPGFIRESGIGAERRVERILGESGAVGVLDEVDLIHSDWARSRYLLVLVDRAKLTDDEQVRALSALRKGDSDYEKSRVLQHTDWLDLRQGEVRRAFLDTTATIDSDYESRRVLATLLAISDLPGETIEEVIRQAGDIASDYEKSTVLRAIAPEHLASEAAVSAYLEVASSIDSDYERRRAMSSLLSAKRLSASDTARAIEAAAGIDSDYEKSSLLIETAKGQSLDGPSRRAYLGAAESIDSDYEKRRSLVALLAVPDLAEPELAELLRTAASVSSDYEKASVLCRAAEARGLGGEAQREYVRAVATIGSGYERQRSLKALLASTEPERDTLLGVLALLETFAGDSDKAAVLTRIAPRIGDDRELEEAFLRATETLRGDSDYRRVMRSLHRDGATPRRASDRG
jgi:hypothetical protein